MNEQDNTATIEKYFIAYKDEVTPVEILTVDEFTGLFGQYRTIWYANGWTYEAHTVGILWNTNGGGNLCDFDSYAAMEKWVQETNKGRN